MEASSCSIHGGWVVQWWQPQCFVNIGNGKVTGGIYGASIGL